MGLDSRSLLTSSATIVLTILLAGCAGFPPRFVSGSDAADRIEVDIGGLIAARHPSVTVGRAQCPFLIDVTERRSGTCTLPVSGLAVRIEVARGMAVTIAAGTEPPPVVRRYASVDALDDVVVRSDAEREIADLLESSYGRRFGVRCPGAALRVVEIGRNIHCDVTTPKRGSVTAQTGNGYLYVTSSAIEQLRVETLDPHAVTPTRTGAVIDGRLLARRVIAIAGDTRHAALERRHLIGSAYCPARITFPATKPVECSVVVGARSLRYRVSYTKAHGVVLATDSMVEITAEIRELAQRYYTHIWPLTHPGAKAAPRLVTDCGPAPVIIIDEDQSFPCRMVAGTTILPIEINAGVDSRDFWFDDALH